MFRKWLVCVAVFTLTPVHYFQNIQDTDSYIPCDEGWYLFGGKCYKLFGGDLTNFGRLSWEEASKKCNAYGGYLATVHSKEIQDFLLSFLLLESDVEVWIGLNDIQEETRYNWLDGIEFKYSNWNVNEPAEHKIPNEDCVQMLLNIPRGEPGKWNDRPCNVESAYICQVDKGKQNKRSRDPTVCPPGIGGGWKFGDSCYNIVKESMTWDDAEAHCQDHYKGHLVSILNFQTEYFLTYMMANFSTDIWIGIKIKDPNEQTFSSGWPVIFKNWLKIPRAFVDGTCVVRRKKKWEVVTCQEKYPFICEVSTVSPQVHQNEMEDFKCPPLMTELLDLGGEYCYYINTENNYNWYEANFECTRRGGSLASFHSKQELYPLAPFAKNVLLRNRGIFIGLYRKPDNENIFEWTDGSQINFAYWSRSESGKIHEKCVEALPPSMKLNEVNCEERKGYICTVKKTPLLRNNIQDTENKDDYILCDEGWFLFDCVQMLLNIPRGEPGKWNDRPCNVESAYICQVDEGKQNKRSRDPTKCLSELGDGWKFGDSCYNIVKESMTWDDAETYCQNKYKGHLVSILNFQTEYFLKYIMANFATSIWIGIKIKDQTQQKFSSGSPAMYTNWLKTSRNGMDDACVVLRTENWKVVPCVEKYSFICEASTVTPPALQSQIEEDTCQQLGTEWVDLGGENCYYIDIEDNYNWYQANFECTRRGGSLASFHSKEQLDLLSPFAKNVLLRHRGIYIGLYRAPDIENIFEWTDGSQMNFEYWSGGDPSNILEKCVEALPPSMKWNDVRCEERKGYICAVKKLPLNTTETETESHITMPPNMTETEAQIASTSCIIFKITTGVTVCILFVVIILLVVLIYFRPWEKRTKRRRRKTTPSIAPSSGIVFPEMYESCFREQTGEVIVNDSDDLYEVMD